MNINQTNFFNYTFCEFIQVENFNFPVETSYKSKSESLYFYTKEGVYRKSNHWGRVANCRWKLISNENYKNQKTVIGFAKWNDFSPINSSKKLFYIDVDFDKKTAKIIVKKEGFIEPLFTYSEAQKRIKQIHHLFKNSNWTKYFEDEKDVLEKKVIQTFINSNKKISEIKSELK